MRTFQKFFLEASARTANNDGTSNACRPMFHILEGLNIRPWVEDGRLLADLFFGLLFSPWTSEVMEVFLQVFTTLAGMSLRIRVRCQCGHKSSDDAGVGLSPDN